MYKFTRILNAAHAFLVIRTLVAVSNAECDLPLSGYVASAEEFGGNKFLKLLNSLIPLFSDNLLSFIMLKEFWYVKDALFCFSEVVLVVSWLGVCFAASF